MDAEQEVSSRVNMQAVRRKITRRHADCLIASLDGGKYVDIQSEFTWSVPNLTDRQRLFIFYYTYPFDNSARGNGAKAAKLAGYTKKQAQSKRVAVQVLQNPEIQREMSAFSLQITKISTKINLETAVNAFIADKIKRTSVNPLDYYTFEERESDTGYTYTVAIPKLPTNLTEAQKKQILDVEYVGAKGLLHYKLPDRIATENEVIKLWRDLGGGAENDKDAFEVETTAEIIKGNLTMKTRVMSANKALSDLSDMQGNTATERVEED